MVNSLSPASNDRDQRACVGPAARVGILGYQVIEVTSGKHFSLLGSFHIKLAVESTDRYVLRPAMNSVSVMIYYIAIGSHVPMMYEKPVMAR